MSRFFVTTAIDYVNSRPHLGTAYEKIAADVIARYKRLCGDDTWFLMGNDEHSQNVFKKAAEAGLARVYPIGAVSRGQNGEQLADIAELKTAGCVAVTDDGRPVATALLMRRALEYTSMFDMPVIEHCE